MENRLAEHPWIDLSTLGIGAGGRWMGNFYIKRNSTGDEYQSSRQLTGAREEITAYDYESGEIQGEREGWEAAPTEKDLVGGSEEDRDNGAP